MICAYSVEFYNFTEQEDPCHQPKPHQSYFFYYFPQYQPFKATSLTGKKKPKKTLGLSTTWK